MARRSKKNIKDRFLAFLLGTVVAYYMLPAFAHVVYWVMILSAFSAGYLYGQ